MSSTIVVPVNRQGVQAGGFGRGRPPNQANFYRRSCRRSPSGCIWKWTKIADCRAETEGRAARFGQPKQI